MVELLNLGRHFAWEWPTTAWKGWSSRAIRKILAAAEKAGHTLYWCRIDGCAYGHRYKGVHIMKKWTILTSSYHFYVALQARCSGDHHHVACRGVVAQYSSYYPYGMVKKAAKAMSRAIDEGPTGYSLEEDMEKCLTMATMEELGDETLEMYPLERNPLPAEPPTGAKLQKIRSQMMRVHRASGHSSFHTLAKLLAKRGSPSWAIEMAKGLRCDACEESKRPMAPPVADPQGEPNLWEIVGMDVFEMQFEEGDLKMKVKGLLMIDRASKLASCQVLATYKDNQSWEPTSRIIINAILDGWLQRHPTPLWFLTDAATYFCSQEFDNFCGLSGIGHMSAPTEAHHLMGVEESTIGKTKQTTAKLMNEYPDLPAQELLLAATWAHNNALNPTGYAPVQWAHGAGPGDELPTVTDPAQAMQGLLELRRRAANAYQKAIANQVYSRLGNTTNRPAENFQPGDLAMIWRQKVKPGKMSGRWLGPVRILAVENQNRTYWIIAGNTLVKARSNQIRKCTRGEELGATVKGAVVMRGPVTLGHLLRDFTGRNYLDISGEVPNQQQMQEDLTPAVVQIQPRQRARPHLKERGRSRTPKGPRVERGAEEQPQPQQPEDQAAGQPQEQQAQQEELQESAGAGLPRIPEVETDGQKNINRVLRDRGVDALDGHPKRPKQNEAAGSNQCSVPECVRPGGHRPPHSDAHGREYVWDPQTSRKIFTEDASDEEEMIPDEADDKASEDEDEEKPKEIGFIGFIREIHIEKKDFRKFKRDPVCWLSAKMQEKSKEVSWNHLTEEERTEFDESMAVEISNVLRSAALRSLNKEEKNRVTPSQAMKMRWVLTYKSTGASKARLVVLGYMAGNLTKVETHSPTMSKAGKYALLAAFANNKFRVKAGDVTSGFFQALEDMECQELYALPPPEVISAFGGDPRDRGFMVKLRKAFYGLAHAPRAWFKDVVQRLTEAGWRQLAGDKCIFVLLDKDAQTEAPNQKEGVINYEAMLLGKVIGLCGIHVDDFLVGGDESNEKYMAAEKALQEAYKWGKWESGDFEFAGTRLRQHPSYDIEIDQENYTKKFIKEIPLTADRAKEKYHPLTDMEVSELRGALGCLSWRANQSAPQYAAEVGLRLSEVSKAKVETIIGTNKLIREAQNDFKQTLKFHAWGRPWREITSLVWADAAQGNRPDGASTVGLVGGYAPAQILGGTREKISVVLWKSQKAPRASLGSNGSEVQSITVGEDFVFLLRALWCELNGVVLERYHWQNIIAHYTTGALMMDSRGIFDAATRNESALHGLRSSRAGYELSAAVTQAKKLNTDMRWVNGGAMLADTMTKKDARKSWQMFLSLGQLWHVRHDPSFESFRKVNAKSIRKAQKELELPDSGTEQEFWDEPQRLRENLRKYGACEFPPNMEYGPHK